MAERVAVSPGDRAGGRAPRQDFRFDAVARSHQGLVRGHNEDFVFAGDNLVAVADGVGGNVFGEVASEVALTAICYLDDRVYNKDPDEEVREAAEYANAQLGDAIEKDHSLFGMATTLTALRLDGSSVVVLNVGDSRAYLLRDRQWVQLTRDDSVVQDMVDAGLITEDEAMHHPSRSVVLQALTGGPFRPTVSTRDVAAGDRYLVCSDGLSDYVDGALIREIVASSPSPEVCCDALIEAALDIGAPDNVSCVVADVAALTGT